MPTTESSASVDSSNNAETIDLLIREVAALARAIGREELAMHAERQSDRLHRESFSVAVVGEYKRGKSCLVNALLGRDVCPVSATMSTDVPAILRSAHRERAILTLATGEDAQQVEAPVASLGDLVLGDPFRVPTQRKVVAIAELDNPFLGEGFTLIDAPGTGGLSPGYQESSANIASVAEIVLVVVDAGSPLASLTVDFVERLSRECPAVLVVATRIDLYRHQGSVSEITSQLRKRGLDVPVLPVSSALRKVAVQSGEPDIDVESGFPTLFAALRREANIREQRALAVALYEAGRVLRALDEIAEPSHSHTDWEARLAEEREGLEMVRRHSSRWATILNEGVADAAAAGELDLRAQLREVAREFDEELDSSRNANAEDIRGRVLLRAEATVSQVLDDLLERLATLENEISSLFQLEAPGGHSLVPGFGLPVWDQSARRPDPRVKAAAAGVYGSLKGAQTGIIMVGVFAGIAGFGMGTLALLGIGAAFGARQILDERGKRGQARRQQIKAAIRQYLDEVQVEGGRAIREVTRGELRRQREAFSELANSCLTARTSQYRWVEQQQSAARASKDEVERRNGAAREALAHLRSRFEALQ